MKQELVNKCDLLSQNNKVINKLQSFGMTMMNLSGALLFTQNDIEVNKEEFKLCEKLLKDRTGIFSDFRGNVKIPVICKMVLADNSEEYLDKLERLYKLLKHIKWGGNEHKIMAAVAIADNCDEADFDKYVDRTEEIYKRMKEGHSFLTSDEDLPLAAILATSDLDVNKLINDMEDCYSILKTKFHDSNAVQSLSHVLSLGDKSPVEKCNKVFDIFDELKAEGHKFGTGYELSVLGCIAISDISVDEIVKLIGETDDYLKKQKGFGNFSLGSKERRMFAAQLVSLDYNNNYGALNSVVVGSALTMTIASQVALMICITSACVASSTAAASH